MVIGRITGSIVATSKDERLQGRKMLVVQPLDMKTLEPDGKPLVSIDSIGSGTGEVVMVVGGSSARQTNITKDTPVDSAIVAIIDHIDMDGERTFTSEGGGG
ncbi:EutN/CcmL family microcompartment protein [Alkalicoccus chagannorensis]|uniref:EutN/CcmL family microcompartment protein n=1 Tax=Alkalicoccus chagannorensis TaxID=427072 RepID=UPI0003FC1D9F|nr:EutN/CcmL family microcompartment protein [Alkalicoccus chagannorensis]